MKQVVDEVTNTSPFKSPGIRGELRVADPALAGVNTIMRRLIQGRSHNDGADPFPCPSGYIALPTATFLKWVRWNVNRLCLGKCL